MSIRIDLFRFFWLISDISVKFSSVSEVVLWCLVALVSVSVVETLVVDVNTVEDSFGLTTKFEHFSLHGGASIIGVSFSKSGSFDNIHLFKGLRGKSK